MSTSGNTCRNWLPVTCTPLALTVELLALSVVEQAVVNLTQSDRERLLTRLGGDKWANELKDRVIDALEVIIDLASSLSSKDGHERLPGIYY